MSDDAVRLSLIARIVRRRWALLGVCAMVGALAGAGASVQLSPGYESTSTVLVQGSLDDAELATEAQIAMSSVVLERSAEELDSDTAEELRSAMSTDVRDGNLIAITGAADTPERAQQRAERVTTEYVDFSQALVTTATGDSIRLVRDIQGEVAEINRTIDELQAGELAAAGEGELENGSLGEGSTELSELRSALTEAVTELDGAAGDGGDAAFGRASLLTLEPAALPAAPAAPTAEHLLAGGALVGLVLGFFGQLLAVRTSRRSADRTEIAGALGTPVLASVDVADRPTAADEPSRLRRWWMIARTFAHDDRPWQAGRTVISADGGHAHYQRLLDRLAMAPGAGLRLLVVVPDDDRHAQRAATRLAITACHERATVIITDDPGITRTLRAAAPAESEEQTVAPSVLPTAEAAALDDAGAEPSGVESAWLGQRTILHVVAVSAAEPAVPAGEHASGALLVMTAGTRTQGELHALAEASAEAGHTLVGALLAHPAHGRTHPATSTEPFETPVGVS